MTNEELVSMYQKTKDPAILEKICIQNRGLVFRIVRGFRAIYAQEGRGRASVIESDDLAQDGFIGLIGAARAYDPDRGAAFSTVAALHIRGAIMRGLNDRGRLIRLPVYKGYELRAIRKARDKFIQEYRRSPYTGELAALTGLDAEKVVDILESEKTANIASLDRPLDEDGGTLSDIVPDASEPIATVEESIFQEELGADLWAAVDELEARQAEVIRDYYASGKTLREIGDSLGVSTSAVNIIKIKALNTLRNGQRARILREYAGTSEKAEGVAYRGSLASYNRTGTSATEQAAFIRLEGYEKAEREAGKYRSMNEGGLSNQEQKALHMKAMEEKQLEIKRRLARLKLEF